MKNFIVAAFKISLFQVLFISVMAGLKYVLTTYNIIDKIEKPFIWLCLVAGFIFIVAISLMGLIENRGVSFEEWSSAPKTSTKDKYLASFVSWGFAIPGALAFVLFIYMITPTSILMFIGLYTGIVIRNSITYFSE